MAVKRIIASISASFEDFVNKVENHEAVADSMISAVRQGAARTRGEINLLNRQLQHQQDEIQKFQDQSQQWEQRARTSAATDKEKALQCLAKQKQLKSRIATATNQLTGLRQLKTELAVNLADVEQKLHELMHRKASLRARDTRAQTLSVAQGGQPLDEALQVFQRWEGKVIDSEYRANANFDSGADSGSYSSGEVDDLEQNFMAEEERAEFENQLKKLLADDDD